jgi:hypothetical protein
MDRYADVGLGGGQNGTPARARPTIGTASVSCSVGLLTLDSSNSQPTIAVATRAVASTAPITLDLRIFGPPALSGRTEEDSIGLDDEEEATLT